MPRCPTTPSNRSRWPAISSALRQRRLEHIQRQAAQIQCATVEFLQWCSATDRLVTQLLPDPLSDRIRRRLARPAEVAVQLEAKVGLLHRAVRLQKHPRLLRIPYIAVRRGHTAVHADVNDYAGGPEPLSIKHSHPITCIVKPAELCHQPLGVQRPALAVTRNPATQSAPAVQLIGENDGPADLQMMARYAFVEDGGGLLPRM